LFSSGLQQVRRADVTKQTKAYGLLYSKEKPKDIAGLKYKDKGKGKQINKIK
jgi:hypothetical protein